MMPQSLPPGTVERFYRDLTGLYRTVQEEQAIRDAMTAMDWPKPCAHLNVYGTWDGTVRKCGECGADVGPGPDLTKP